MPENFKAYEGKEPFAFISYAHKDTDIVLPVIRGLQARGVRVWFDGGLELAERWPKRIATHMEKCSCVLAFVSRNFGESENCAEEIQFASDEKKPIAVVYLEPREKLTADNRMRFGRLHALFYNRSAGVDGLVDALVKEAVLRPCVGGPGRVGAGASGGSDYSFWENPAAWYSRGMEYFQAENYAEAVIWLRKAAEKDHGQAQYQMGVCWEKGLGMSLHLENALMWYWRAKDKKDPRAQEAIFRVEAMLRPQALAAYSTAGRYYQEGNYEQAAAWYRKAARKGYARAQYRLAQCYDAGEGVRQSVADAAWWYLKAAERGHAESQYLLCTYMLGLVLWPDSYERKHESAKWLGRAAAQGHAQAQYSMGRKYSGEKAVMWFRRAAEQGHAGAQYELGECYYYGKGVRKDLIEAAALYRKAADKGNAPAQYSLGWCYEHGQGVGKDEKEALSWYRKAADQGNKDAQRNMGLCCEYGRGCSRNLKYALAWYQKAKENKHPDIEEDIARCKKKRIFPWIK